MLKFNQWINVLMIILISITLVSCGKEAGSEDLINEQPPISDPTSHASSNFHEEFIQRFLEQDYAYVFEHMTEELQQSIPLESLSELSEPFNQEVQDYYLEATMPFGSSYKYTWLDDQRMRSVSIYINMNNEISGFWIYPITTYPETDQVYSNIEYSFPFKGQWFTYWGGMNEIVNYHYPFEEQRYAYDFLIMKNNYTFAADIESNESYYAYGESVYAPADGVVVTLEDGIEDNEPGTMDPYHPEGNYIIIDHGQGEYSMLAHLQYGSIEVEVGDKVQRGDLLAHCGNSGNSSEPHIHFQIMDSPDIAVAKSINPRFKGYDYVVQGDFINGDS